MSSAEGRGGNGLIYRSAADVPVGPSEPTTGGCAGAVPQKWTISVYIDDGLVFDYEVDSLHSAREHASAIVATGYRSVQYAAPDTLTHYPPHRITKVKVKSPTAIQSHFFDRVRGV